MDFEVVDDLTLPIRNNHTRYPHKGRKKKEKVVHPRWSDSETKVKVSGEIRVIYGEIVKATPDISRRQACIKISQQFKPTYKFVNYYFVDNVVRGKNWTEEKWK